MGDSGDSGEGASPTRLVVIGKAESEPIITGGVSREEASRAGVVGLIVWAMAQLGRYPAEARIYEKLNEGIPRHGQVPRWDFRQKLLQLHRQGIIKPGGGAGCWQFAATSERDRFKITCFSKDCNTSTAWAKTKEDARALADADGFLITDLNHAFCPRCRVYVETGHMPPRGEVTTGDVPTYRNRRERREFKRSTRKGRRP